jgi:hypothetical protein
MKVPADGAVGIAVLPGLEGLAAADRNHFQIRIHVAFLPAFSRVRPGSGISSQRPFPVVDPTLRAVTGDRYYAIDAGSILF